MEFKIKLYNRWLSPYEVDIIYDNRVVKLRTIDEEKYPIIANGHKLKLYNKPISKEEFIAKLQEQISLTMVELGYTSHT